MSQKITPFLWFDRNAEEAMKFYTGIFKNSKIKDIMRYPDGIKEGPMAGFDGQVLTGVFELEGQQFMCLDGGPVFKPGGAISFLVECKDQAEIDYFWERLGEGSDSSKWQCGWLEDKFGFWWQISPNMTPWLRNPDKAKADKATQAMLKMKKIIIADFEKAMEG